MEYTRQGRWLDAIGLALDFFMGRNKDPGLPSNNLLEKQRLVTETLETVLVQYVTVSLQMRTTDTSHFQTVCRRDDRS